MLNNQLNAKLGLPKVAKLIKTLSLADKEKMLWLTENMRTINEPINVNCCKH